MLKNNKISGSITGLTIGIISVFIWAFFVPGASAQLSAGFDKLEAVNSRAQLPSKIEDTITPLIKAALSLVGTVFLILTIYAGILWMTAQGKEDRIEKAQNIIKASIIGLVITMSAYAITAFIGGRLSGATTGGGTAPGGGAPQGITTPETCKSAGGWCMDTALTTQVVESGINREGVYELAKYDDKNPCDPNNVVGKVDPFMNKQLGTCKASVVCCELKKSVDKCKGVAGAGGECRKNCGPGQKNFGKICDLDGVTAQSCCLSVQ